MPAALNPLRVIIHSLPCFLRDEAGIRHGTVTGVQTCDLPLCGARAPRRFEHRALLDGRDPGRYADEHPRALQSRERKSVVEGKSVEPQVPGVWETTQWSHPSLLISYSRARTYEVTFGGK